MCGSSRQNLNAPYYVNAKKIFTLDNDLPQWHLCHDTRARAWDVVLGRKLFNCENRAYEKKVAALRPIRHYLHTRAPPAAPSNAQIRKQEVEVAASGVSEWARLMPNYCDVISKMWQSCVKIRAQSPACLRSHDKTFGYLLLPGKPIADRSAHRKGSQSSQWEFYLEQKDG